MESFNTPDDGDVLQQDEESAKVDVIVKNVVRVDEMPTRSGGAITVSADDNGVRVLNRDDRRKVATIISLDQNILIGNSQSDVLNTAGGAEWPINVPLLITSADEWWAASAVVGATTKITVVNENWAN